MNVAMCCEFFSNTHRACKYKYSQKWRAMNNNNCGCRYVFYVNTVVTHAEFQMFTSKKKQRFPCRRRRLMFQVREAKRRKQEYSGILSTVGISTETQRTQDVVSVTAEEISTPLTSETDINC